MRLSANRHAKGSMIYQPMGSQTPQSGHNGKDNPNYRHLNALARSEKSSIHRDVIATVGHGDGRHG
jgi:hypothetical protein